MPLEFNITKLNLTRDWKYFKLFLIPVNSALAVINTFLLFYFPEFSTAISQASVHLKTISAVRVTNRSRINHFLNKTTRSNSMSILFVALLSASIMSCQSRVNSVSKKDLGTDLKTEHRTIEPEASMLVINDLLLRVIGISN